MFIIFGLFIHTALSCFNAGGRCGSSQCQNEGVPQCGSHQCPQLTAPSLPAHPSNVIPQSLSQRYASLHVYPFQRSFQSPHPIGPSQNFVKHSPIVVPHPVTSNHFNHAINEFQNSGYQILHNERSKSRGDTKVAPATSSTNRINEYSDPSTQKSENGTDDFTQIFSNLKEENTHEGYQRGNGYIDIAPEKEMGHTEGVIRENGKESSETSDYSLQEPKLNEPLLPLPTSTPGASAYLKELPNSIPRAQISEEIGEYKGVDDESGDVHTETDYKIIGNQNEYNRGNIFRSKNVYESGPPTESYELNGNLVKPFNNYAPEAASKISKEQLGNRDGTDSGNYGQSEILYQPELSERGYESYEQIQKRFKTYESEAASKVSKEPLGNRYGSDSGNYGESERAHQPESSLRSFESNEQLSERFETYKLETGLKGYSEQPWNQGEYDNEKYGESGEVHQHEPDVENHESEAKVNGPFNIHETESASKSFVERLGTQGNYENEKYSETEALSRAESLGKYESYPQKPFNSYETEFPSKSSEERLSTRENYDSEKYDESKALRQPEPVPGSYDSGDKPLSSPQLQYFRKELESSQKANAAYEGNQFENIGQPCNDAELHSIIENVLHTKSDNLGAAREIEKLATRKFGGRFNSIISNAEFAYVNWHGRRNCRITLADRHSLTWEE